MNNQRVSKMVLSKELRKSLTLLFENLEVHKFLDDHNGFVKELDEIFAESDNLALKNIIARIKSISQRFNHHQVKKISKFQELVDSLLNSDNPKKTDIYLIDQKVAKLNKFKELILYFNFKIKMVTTYSYNDKYLNVDTRISCYQVLLEELEDLANKMQMFNL